MTNSGIFSVARLRRLWADDDLSNAQIAVAIGYSPEGLRGLARKLGLPRRRLGPKSRIDTDLLARLWSAGVSKREIAALFGVDRSTLCHAAQKIGLPRRPGGWVPLMTYDQFQQQELGRMLAREAATTRAALHDAEMVDSPQAFWRLTRRAA